MNETQAIAIRNAYCSLIKIIYSDAFPDVFSDAHESLKLTDRTYKKL